jgi:hypothetical protein
VSPAIASKHYQHGGDDEQSYHDSDRLYPAPNKSGDSGQAIPQADLWLHLFLPFDVQSAHFWRLVGWFPKSVYLI